MLLILFIMNLNLFLRLANETHLKVVDLARYSNFKVVSLKQHRCTISTISLTLKMTLSKPGAVIGTFVIINSPKFLTRY